MENQCQNLAMTQQNELKNYHRSTKSCLMEHLAPGKISIRLWIKRGREANLIATISSTEVTRRNVLKRGWMFSSTRITWGSKWFRIRSPILCST